MDKIKQTAVEWLIEEIHKNMEFIPVHIQEQAIAMHKQEIEDAVNLPIEKRWYDAKLYNNSGEQYYQETYNKS